MGGLHNRASGMTRRNRRHSSGVAILEALVAAVILGGALFYVIGVLRNFGQARQRNRAMSASQQYEQEIRGTVFAAAKGFFVNAALDAANLCRRTNGQFATSVSQTLPSGVLLKLLYNGASDTATQTSIAGVSIPSANGKAQTAMQRCATMQTIGTTGITNFSGSPGLYFCLMVLPASAAASEAGGLLAKQPVFAEFTLYHTLLATGVRPNCNVFNVGWNATPRAPMVGYLYYTFYWTDSGSEQNVYKSQTGLLALGAS